MNGWRVYTLGDLATLRHLLLPEVRTKGAGLSDDADAPAFHDGGRGG